MSSVSAFAIGRLDAALKVVDRVLGIRSRSLLTTWALLATFALVTAERLLGANALGTFAIDLRIYRAAADAAIRGGDPWMAGVGSLTFAGPPPSLLAYVPAALLPESTAIAVYGAITIAAAVLAVRAVGVPIWWLLFPPISDSLIVLNPDVVVIALLVAIPRLAPLSVVLKVYAAVPLALAGRWQAIVGGLVLCLLSIPWWPAFLSAGGIVESSLATQSFGGLSAWGTLLMIPTVVALVVLWRRGAEWLAVPAIWPYTQLHYAAIALPIAARNPVVAFLLSFPVAFLPVVATIFYAVSLVLAARLATYRSGATTIEPSSSV